MQDILKKQGIVDTICVTHNISGEDECEGPPVPIPNTEVKLDIADDSWGSPPVKIGFRQFFYIPL